MPELRRWGSADEDHARALAGAVARLSFPALVEALLALDPRSRQAVRELVERGLAARRHEYGEERR